MINYPIQINVLKNKLFEIAFIFFLVASGMHSSVRLEKQFLISYSETKTCQLKNNSNVLIYLHTIGKGCMLSG